MNKLTFLKQSLMNFKSKELLIPELLLYTYKMKYIFLFNQNFKIIVKRKEIVLIWVIKIVIIFIKIKILMIFIKPFQLFN